MSTTPAVAPLPPLAVGLPVFLAPEPTIAQIEDPAARPVALTLQHHIRDTLEEAGFKLAPSPEASAGLVLSVAIGRVSAIHADLFIHGTEACGVRVDLLRAGVVLMSAEPDVACVSTSSYYGMVPKDAAVSLVNMVSHAPVLLAVAESLRVAATAPSATPAGVPRGPAPSAAPSASPTLPATPETLIN